MTIQKVKTLSANLWELRIVKLIVTPEHDKRKRLNEIASKFGYFIHYNHMIKDTFYRSNIQEDIQTIIEHHIKFKILKRKGQ